MKGENISAAQIAQDSVDKLKSYRESVDPSNIPKNQFGSAARRPICEELDITYSTIGTNDGLSEEFSKLDKLINTSPRSAKRKTADTKHLEMRITSLENRVTALKADNESLRSKLKMYEHFELTGRLPH